MEELGCVKDRDRPPHGKLPPLAQRPVDAHGGSSDLDSFSIVNDLTR